MTITPHIDVARSVADNRAVGRPVSASDADDVVLFYELLDIFDLEDEDGRARFTIGSFSGQIRVGRELGADEGEVEDEDSTDLPGDHRAARGRGEQQRLRAAGEGERPFDRLRYGELDRQGHPCERGPSLCR